MNRDNLLAEAAKAEAAANAIFAKIEVARSGSDALIPAGMRVEAERASDFMRRARNLRADASQIALDSVQPPVAVTPAAPTATVTTPTSAAARHAPPLAPAAAETETADAIAARILNSDSAVPVEVHPPHMGPGAAETADTIAERILRA